MQNPRVQVRRVLMVGEEPPVRSAPQVTLAAELSREGVASEFSMGVERISNRKWLKLVWRSDALVLVQYGRTDIYLQRQLHLARLLGCLVVRWWVGSDVLFGLQSKKVAASARALDVAVDLNVAAAPHLVEELESIGISAEYVPSVCNLSALDRVLPPSLPSSVLVYLPTDRKAFYGNAVVTAAIKAHPDLQFIIVNDESHSLAHYSNVKSLGWVDNMEEVWRQVGVLLRVTEHDGLPRMVLEALARGRYVIYSWPLDGCWLAATRDEVLRELDRFKSVVGPNAAGRDVARAIASGASRRYVEAMTDSQSSTALGRRLSSLSQAVRCQWAMKGYAEQSG